MHLSPLSFRDTPLGVGPESIPTIVVMDSGLAAMRRPGMTERREAYFPNHFGWRFSENAFGPSI